MECGAYVYMILIFLILFMRCAPMRGFNFASFFFYPFLIDSNEFVHSIDSMHPTTHCLNASARNKIAKLVWCLGCGAPMEKKYSWCLFVANWLLFRIFKRINSRPKLKRKRNEISTIADCVNRKWFLITMSLAQNQFECESTNTKKKSTHTHKRLKIEIYCMDFRVQKERERKG